MGAKLVPPRGITGASSVTLRDARNPSGSGPASLAGVEASCSQLTARFDPSRASAPVGVPGCVPPAFAPQRAINERDQRPDEESHAKNPVPSWCTSVPFARSDR